MIALLTLIAALTLVLGAHKFKQGCDQRSVRYQARGHYGLALDAEDRGVAVLCAAYFCAGIFLAILAAIWWLS
jgi:hypothetical protein